MHDGFYIQLSAYFQRLALLTSSDTITVKLQLGDTQVRSDQGKVSDLDINVTFTFLFRLKHRPISGRPELPRLAAVNLKEAAQANRTSYIAHRNEYLHFRVISN